VADLPASLSGKNHPLSGANNNAGTSGAVEIVKGANGQDETKPLSKLSAGDHTIQLENGRQFLVHMPPANGSTKLPVRFVFTGSAEPQWNIKDFAPETGMSKVADEDPKHPFIAVYALPKKHDLGIFSKTPAFGWNTEGVLLDRQDQKQAGYDDIKDYVKPIVGLMPQLANVDTTHKNWSAVAFSQGGIFLNKVVSTIPHLFPSIGLVGTSMQTNYRYDIKPGNAQNVAIVELLGDKTTLPMRTIEGQSLKYDKQVAERTALKQLGPAGKMIIESRDPLSAIDNSLQNPMLQNRLYLSRLGHKGRDYTVGSSHLSTPAANDKKDFEIDYKPKNNKDHRRVTVFGLVTAPHSYPAPLYGPRTNGGEKYTEFDTSRKLSGIFNAYDDSQR